MSRLIRPKGLIFIYSRASNILRLSHDLEERDSYLPGSFAVKPMFWFSLLANEITGNFMSSLVAARTVEKNMKC